MDCFAHRMDSGRTFRGMAERRSALSPALPATVLEREASELLRTVMRRRRFTYKLLSRALEGYGESLAPTTLSNRVGRGKFSMSFFVLCLYAMNLNDVRMALGGMAEDELAEVQRAAARRAKRAPPPPGRKPPRTRRRPG